MKTYRLEYRVGWKKVIFSSELRKVSGLDSWSICEKHFRAPNDAAAVQKAQKIWRRIVKDGLEPYSPNLTQVRFIEWKPNK